MTSSGQGDPTRVHPPRRRPAEQAHGLAGRLRASWRALTPDQRLAAIAALALLLAMLLPWYRESNTIVVEGQAQKVSNSLNAFQVYSFVEAAIFVVVVGVLVLLWARGERRTFHLPGGDGTVIMGAGLWTMLLIFYRQFDRPNRHGPNVDVSVDWGIFVAFLLAAGLAYAGYRIRAAHVPEPVEAAPPPPPPPRDAPQTAVARRRPARSADEHPEGQLSFEEPTEQRPPPRR